MIILRSLTKQLFWIPITTDIIADGTYPFNVLPGDNIMGQQWLSTYELIHYQEDSDDYELLIQFANEHKKPGCIGIQHKGKLNIFGIEEHMPDGSRIKRATIFNAALSERPGVKVRMTGILRPTSCTYYVSDHYPDGNPELYYIRFSRGHLVDSEDIRHFCKDGEMQCY